MQYVNVNGVITTTAYLLGGLEESTGGVITKYLGVAGLPSAVRVGSTLSYLTTDGLGSVSESFDTSGAETATQLFAPYGTVRYAANSLPTTKGFTGQHADVTTGLDYYVARYYDPQAGQFASADSQADGLSPYAYVKGKPETATDPSGCLYSVGPGGGNPSRRATAPSPRFPNRYDYINNLESTGGLPGQQFINFNVAGAGGTNPATPQEINDGQVLFSYFGGAYGGPSVFCVPDSPGTQSVYGTRADYEVGYIPLGIGLDNFSLNTIDVAHATPIDLYSPESKTTQPEAFREIRQKGKNQASIVVVDISNNPELQAEEANGTLYGLTENQVLLNKDNAASHTSVARVIYIDNGTVVDDVNPFNYGPPRFVGNTQA